MHDIQNESVTVIFKFLLLDNVDEKDDICLLEIIFSLVIPNFCKPQRFFSIYNVSVQNAILSFK